MKNRLLCLLLAVVLVISFSNISAISGSIIEDTICEKKEEIKESQLIESSELSLEEIPGILRIAGVSQEKHKKRLYEEEILNTFVFQNNDRTNTTYFYNEFVKYVDNTGKIQEKDNTLYADQTEKYYTNKANDINVSIPYKLASGNGIQVRYKDFLFEMYPISTKESDAVLKENKVIYDSALGDKTELIYEALFSGLKEVIVLYEKENVGNEFKFILNTNGLGLKKDKGVLGLYNNKNEDIIRYNSLIQRNSCI